MRRVFSIALALAVALSMLVVVPASAVTPNTILVTLANQVALQDSEYTVRFQNGAALVGTDGDYIDVTFPVGTTFGALVGVTVFQGPNLAGVTDPNGVLVPTLPHVLVGARGVRIYLAPGEVIAKYQWVRIEFEDITNPTSCFHNLQVGTSNYSGSRSADYMICTAKMELVEGMNLISLPAYPVDTAIEVVLAGLFAEVVRTAATATPFVFSVWYWDSWTQEWLIYASDTSFSSLTTMEAGKAYWIKVNYDFDFCFKGDPYPQGQGPPIKDCYPASWSMIGPAIQTAAVNASEYLWDAMLLGYPNTYAVTKIISFNATTQSHFDTGWVPGPRDEGGWQGFVPPAQPLPPYQDVNLVQGQGYFMSFLGEACIIPPVGP